MRFFQLGLTGFLLQLFGICAFIEVSRTNVGVVAKPLVIGLVVILIALLIWIGLRSISLKGALFYLPGLLAFGYVTAFHLVGINAFPALLRDWNISLSYLMAVSGVALTAFIIFSVMSTLLLILRRAIRSGKVFN